MALKDNGDFFKALCLVCGTDADDWVKKSSYDKLNAAYVALLDKYAALEKASTYDFVFSNPKKSKKKVKVLNMDISVQSDVKKPKEPKAKKTKAPGVKTKPPDNIVVKTKRIIKVGGNGQ